MHTKVIRMESQSAGDLRRGTPVAPRAAHATRPFAGRVGGRAALIGAALLLAPMLLPAQSMAAYARAAGQHGRAVQTPPLAAGGVVSLRWGGGILGLSLTARGLAPDTFTQGFLVPGTCSDPGGVAAFRTQAERTDAHGAITDARTKIGAQASGIRLPKAFEVVQNGRVVLCGDTAEDAGDARVAGLVRSASITVTLTTASGPAPGQVPSADPARTGHDPVTLTGKQTLNDTSIDGPALSSVFFTHLGTATALAWTDPAQHLNVASVSSDLAVTNKLTLPETSPFRPDVALSAPESPVTVAWTGTDPNRSLNVLYDVYGDSPKKLTLQHESSFAAPALLARLSAPAQGTSSLFLGWTGTDPNHSLNLLPIAVTAAGLEPGQKTTLSRFSSDAGPHLAWHEPNAAVPTVVLDWTSRARQLMVATSSDGVHFAPESGVGLPETSDFAPGTVNITFFPTTPGPGDWIGWTGTDPAHHLNLQSTTDFPTFPDPAGTKTVLEDTAFGGPALAFNFDGQIAWTGTDPAHHLNIAKYATS